MPYPSASNWNSSDPFSGWYLDRISGRPTNVCSSNGWNLLASLQTELAGRLGAYGPLPDFDGTNVDVSTVDINDPRQASSATGWNVNLLRAMYAVAQHLNVDSAFLEAIHTDAIAAMGPISNGTLQTGIWMGEQIYAGTDPSGNDVYGFSSPSEVVIPDGSTNPNIDLPPPLPTSGESVGGQSCNVIPPNVEALIPVTRTVVPFQFNGLLVFGLIAAAAVAFVALSKNVPVLSREARERQEIARSRNNPRGGRRRRSRYIPFNDLLLQLGVHTKDHGDAWDAIKYNLLWNAKGEVALRNGETLESLRAMLREYGLKLEQR